MPERAGLPYRCPRCGDLSLEPVQYEGTPLEICTNCSGLWCTPTSWDHQRHGTAPIVGPFLERAPDIIDAGPSELECPECRKSFTALHVRGIRDLEIDQCDHCGGVWFDHREWEYLEALRSWERHRKESDRSTSWGEWFFQLILGLPIEFNVPPRRPPVITAAIIAVCLVVQMLGGSSRFDELGIVRENLPSAWGFCTLVTHMFVHAGWLHLVGNLYFLYIIGDNVEDVVGKRLFLLLFLTCGVAGGTLHTIVAAPGGSALVGASGAIAGVMAAYLILFRDAELTFMLIVVQIRAPAWAWLSFWFALQVVGASFDPTGEVTHTGWMAHVGGFVAGLVIVYPARRSLIDGNPLLHLLHERRL